MDKEETINNIDDHNPYFNRWFSAIIHTLPSGLPIKDHNPYFNRWFSAIKALANCEFSTFEITILILIDGFLQ